ncbi:PREDICTED: olfactory receptor 1I1 [Mandrillus leucophaeus]|uniref:olfactory receptor 1I1 n=1 Tax=Mandrillus leucophaeus TaxID=9568 RepID=UPI0005F384DB|nr:PREDICTED: olfactory receptor 1I1 [Mandrillus leucophaeus]
MASLTPGSVWFFSLFVPTRQRPYMEPENQTEISEFFLQGLSEKPEHQTLLFTMFLSTYLVTIIGNVLIILAIITDSHLHTPMYFFLFNLSLVDILLSSTTVPKMLVNIQTQSRAITFAGCLTQMYAFHLFGTMDSFLLAVMAIDRFVVIVHLLRYLVLMCPRVCGLLLGVSWVITNLQSLIHTCLMVQLTFCASSEISHFFCDLMPLLKLSCSDTHTNELMIFASGIVMGTSPLSCILLSYIRIFRTVFKIPSARGKWKAFSTCGSHLTVVSLFYGTIFAMYLQPASPSSSQKDKAATLMCGVVIPMLNPFIYSLRNKDVKAALGKLIGKVAIPCPRPEQFLDVYHVPGSLLGARDREMHPIPYPRGVQSLAGNRDTE